MLRLSTLALVAGLATQVQAKECQQSYTLIKPDGRAITRTLIIGCGDEITERTEIKTTSTTTTTRQAIEQPLITKTAIPDDAIDTALIPEDEKVAVVIPQDTVVVVTVPVSPPVIVPTPEPPFEPGETLVFHNINFEVDKAILIEYSKRIIAALAVDLKKQPTVQVMIEGHTDSDGSTEHNLDLSQRRATAVETALIDFGVSGNRLSTRGMGEGSPMESNSTPAGKAKNRRVVFYLR